MPVYQAGAPADVRQAGMRDYPQPLTRVQAAALAIVVLAHAAILYGLAHHPLLPAPAATPTMYGYLIEPQPAPVQAAAPQPAPPVRPERPRPRKPARHRHSVVKAAPQATPGPVLPAAPVDPESVPGPAVAGVAVAPAGPAQPTTLGNELAVSCPQRAPPDYPALSLRLREEGHVVLRVELDERGQVHRAQVQTSSGSDRLDRAALNAVSHWRCSPARHAGQPVPTVAMQPFDFVIKDR